MGSKHISFGLAITTDFPSVSVLIQEVEILIPFKIDRKDKDKSEGKTYRYRFYVSYKV